MADISKRPDSSSSRSAWNDDGLDAPGRPVSGDSVSSRADRGDLKSAVSTTSKMERKKKKKAPKAPKKENFCQKVINSIWSTRHTQDLVDNDAKAKTVLRELIIYLIYLVIICVVTFGMTSSTQFIMTQVMTDLFVHSAFPDTGNTFAGQLTQTDFWRFAEGPMLDGLYWEKYDNGQNVSDSELGYIYYENKLLGVPRLRQLRVKNDSCTVYKLFENTIPACYADWSPAVNDETAFGLETETAWVFHSERDMNGSSYRATLKTYPGSGYYQDLANTRAKTLQIIRELKQNRWVNRGSRVIFLDFTMYNPNVNLFSIAKLVTEFPASGGAVASAKFTTVKLLRYVSMTDYIVLGCEFVFCAFVLYYTIEEVLEMKKQGIRKYFDEFWNWMDAAVIVLSFVCIGLNIYRTVSVTRVIEELLSTPDQFVDFDMLGNYQLQFNNAIAIMSFMAWFKLFKYISFNKTMTQLTETISQARKDLGSFMIMFLIIFFAFAQIGYLWFGTQISDFRSIKDAIITQLRIILGDFNFYELDAAHGILGPFYFIFYIMVVFFILINMFLAIINDTYSAVKSDTSSGQFEVMIFFKSQYTKMLDKLNVKRDRINDIQNALQVADADDDNEIAFDEWKAELMARGYKDAEIEEAFKKYDLDGNRVLDKREQAEMLKSLQEEKKALDDDIGDVEDKLTGGERPQTAASRPATTRARTGRGACGHTAMGEQPASAAAKNKSKVVSEVGYTEFTSLTRRVDRMELSIGSIVAKIDTVLVKLEGMERAKLRRREAMAQLLDSIAEADDATEEEKREQMERLVREELERWDSEAIISRPASSMSRPGTSRSRPGTGLR